jgi:tetratricopeptide (TPR) repeat protein
MAVAHTFAGNPEEAWNWCQRLLKANPESREANYLQGSLAWMLSFRAEQQGRMKAGIEESNKGPLPDETLRQSLRLSEGERLRTALSGLEKLLRGDPDHADAMEYAGMILRQQASLAESEVEFARLYRQFESRVQQADRMRARKEPARLPVYKAGELPPPFPAPSTPPERIRETLSR